MLDHTGLQALGLGFGVGLRQLECNVLVIQVGYSRQHVRVDIVVQVMGELGDEITHRFTRLDTAVAGQRQSQGL